MPASIPSPPSNGFDLGPFFVHAYGLAYVVAILAAVAIASRRWERAGGDRHLVQEVAIWGVPAGLIGGRLYFLATSWDQVPAHWWGPVAIWDGGLGSWGGIAADTLAGLWVLRRRSANIPRFLDAAAPALLVAQAIGRIGNYFNQELFGGPTSLPWALQIDPAHRPPGYEQYATFHPTFLYELIWNLVLAGALVWLGHHRRIRPGGLFALYVAGYSGFRIFEELLRVDPAHHILGLRLNLYVAAALLLAGLAWFVRVQSHAWPRRFWRRGAGVTVVGAAIALAGCGHSGTARAAARSPCCVSPAAGHATFVKALDAAPHDLDVLLRHRPRSISRWHRGASDLRRIAAEPLGRFIRSAADLDRPREPMLWLAALQPSAAGSHPSDARIADRRAVNVRAPGRAALSPHSPPSRDASAAERPRGPIGSGANHRQARDRAGGSPLLVSRRRWRRFVWANLSPRAPAAIAAGAEAPCV